MPEAKIMLDGQVLDAYGLVNTWKGGFRAIEANDSR